MSHTADRYYAARNLTRHAINRSDYRTAAHHAAICAHLATRAWPWDLRRTRTHRRQAVLLLAVSIANEGRHSGYLRQWLPAAVTVDPKLHIPRRWARRFADRVEGIAGRVLTAMGDMDEAAMLHTASTALYDAVRPIVGGQAAEVLATLPRRYAPIDRRG